MQNLRLIAILAISAGCSGGTEPIIDPPDPPPPPPSAITINTGTAPPPRFIPRTAAVAAGGTVTFHNASPVDHTVKSATDLWPEETLAPGESFTVTLATAGQYPFVCTLHDGMTGLVTVP